MFTIVFAKYFVYWGRPRRCKTMQYYTQIELLIEVMITNVSGANGLTYDIWEKLGEWNWHTHPLSHTFQRNTYQQLGCYVLGAKSDSDFNRTFLVDRFSCLRELKRQITFAIGAIWSNRISNNRIDFHCYSSSMRHKGTRWVWTCLQTKRWSSVV